MENNITDNNAAILEKRNTRLLNILSVLTFIGAGIGLTFGLMYFMFWGKMDVMMAKNDDAAMALKDAIVKVLGQKKWNAMEASGTLSDYYSAMKYYYLFSSFTSLLAIIGVMLLRSKKAVGFFIYIASQVLFVVAPYLFVYQYHANAAESVLWIVLGAVFVFLYARVYMNIKNG